eukprot:SM000028S10121  [mRNA]  locus=s28:444933:445163:- [translate_table: standard]
MSNEWLNGINIQLEGISLWPLLAATVFLRLRDGPPRPQALAVTTSCRKWASTLSLRLAEISGQPCQESSPPPGCER